MNLFNAQVQNLDGVTDKLIKKLNVKINRETVSKSLTGHPNYPSLLSISDVLSEYNIPNQAYNIKREDYNSEDLLFPFLAHLKEKGGKFILVESIENETVVFSDEIKNFNKISEMEFLTRWDGIALHAEKNEFSGEKDYFENFLKFSLNKMIPPIALILLLLILYLSTNSRNFSSWYLLLIGIKMVGVSVSVLLLIQSINSNNPFIQNLCGITGKNDCNSILKSDASKIFSWLSWSEIGFFYFAGSLLVLLINPGSVGLLTLLNILALPYTIYSIHYQYINKNWCLLCCIVQTILWFEFLATLSFGSFLNSINTLNSLFTLFCFLIPIMIWAFLKPFFQKAEQLKPIKRNLELFKSNIDLFNQRLKNQPRFAINDDLMPIELGNPDAENIITIVSSPFCGPCGKAHETLSKWLETRYDIKLKILFSSSSHTAESKKQVTAHLTALGQMGDNQNAERALSAWYDNKLDYEQLLDRYPVDNKNRVSTAIENQKNWCRLTEITQTPTIFINGYKLPEPYLLEDVKYLLS